MRLLFLSALFAVAAAVARDSLGSARNAPHSGREAISVLHGSSLLRKEKEQTPFYGNNPFMGPNDDPDPNADPGDPLPHAEDTPLPDPTEDTAEAIAARLHAMAEDENCENQYEAQGDWCEESCVNPDSDITLAFGTTTVTATDSCVAEGFRTAYQVGPGVDSFQVHDFAESDSTYPELGIYAAGTQCVEQFSIIHGFCQSFCIPPDHPGMVDFVEHRHGIDPGSCAENHYPKWVRTRTVVTYMK